MEEPKLKTVHKHDTNKNEHVQDVHQDGRGEEPTRLQRGYILTLAKSVGLRVDVTKIESKEQASRAIDRLKLLNSRMNGSSFHDDSRDSRAAFGMVTKLMFRRYSAQQRDPLKWKQFWKDVTKFYRRYLEEQEHAIAKTR